jgi:dihydrofolate reductase
VSQLFASVSMSLDGFIAGPNRGPTNPLGDGGIALHDWVFKQKAWKQAHGLGGSGESGIDNQLIDEMLERTGANIMGKRMFDEGEPSWDEEAPFHTAVFVLTHERRVPWRRRGGTSFYFVNDGIESALRQAQDAAGGKDVRVAGGADAIRQYVDSGHMSELQIQLAPVLLGEGVRLFDGLDPNRVSLDLTETIGSRLVTHLRYAVKKS